MKNFFICLFFLLMAISCVREEPDLFSSSGTVDLKIDVVRQGTRSSLDSSVEGLLTNIHVALYARDSGKLDEYYFGPYEDALLKAKAGCMYDIFIIANMPSEQSVVFPSDESDLWNIALDYVSFDSIRQYGIPSCAMLSGRSFSSPSTLQVELERLFSKLRLNINPDGLTAGQQDLFYNSNLYVRSANKRMMPFAPVRSRAISESDLTDLSDFENPMSSEDGVYVLYIPENVGSTHPTYVEFTGILPAGVDASGIDGSLLYRFYPGENHNVARNTSYSLTLSFKAGSIFSPVWEITPDLNDNRDIFLSSGSQRLVEGKTVVVRQNRPARFTLNVHNGVSNNTSISRPLDNDEAIPDLQRPYWTSDIKGRTRAPLDGDLSLAGLSVEYDQSSGEFCISVSNPARFTAGKQFDVQFALLPDRTHNASVRLLTMDDVNVNKPEEIYLAQRGNVSVDNSFGNYDASVSNSYLSMSNVSGTSFDFLCVQTSRQNKSCVLTLMPRDVMNDDPLDIPLDVKIPASKVNPTSSISPLELSVDGTPVSTGLALYTENGASVLPQESFDPDEFSRHFAYSITSEGYYAWCDAVEFLDWTGYPSGLLSLKCLSVDLPWLETSFPNLCPYSLSILTLHPKRPELYPEGSEPNVFVKVIEPFPSDNFLGAFILSHHAATEKFRLALGADISNCAVSWTSSSADLPQISLEPGYVSLSDFTGREQTGSYTFTVTITNTASHQTCSKKFYVDFI